MGPYPLFACDTWPELRNDLDDLGDSAVSVVLVADPLAGLGEPELRATFPDHLSAFKQHHVRDLDAPARLPAHHRRHVKRAARAVEVDICTEPLSHLDEWMRLYEGLASRHGLVGIRAFSAKAFREQLSLPGMLMLRAERNDVTVGMALWLEDAPNAYYHLAAYSPEGYEVSASYALFAAAFDHLREQGVRWVDLGGAAGSGVMDDGLVRFKSGWANGERTAYLCGRVLDRRAYERLAGGSRATDGWFPAYRAGDRDLGGSRR